MGYYDLSFGLCIFCFFTFAAGCSVWEKRAIYFTVFGTWEGLFVYLVFMFYSFQFISEEEEGWVYYGGPFLLLFIV